MVYFSYLKQLYPVEFLPLLIEYLVYQLIALEVDSYLPSVHLQVLVIHFVSIRYLVIHFDFKLLLIVHCLFLLKLGLLLRLQPQDLMNLKRHSWIKVALLWRSLLNLLFLIEFDSIVLLDSPLSFRSSAGLFVNLYIIPKDSSNLFQIWLIVFE